MTKQMYDRLRLDEKHRLIAHMPDWMLVDEGKKMAYLSKQMNELAVGVPGILLQLLQMAEIQPNETVIGSREAVHDGREQAWTNCVSRLEIARQGILFLGAVLESEAEYQHRFEKNGWIVYQMLTDDLKLLDAFLEEKVLLGRNKYSTDPLRKLVDELKKQTDNLMTCVLLLSR